MSVSRAEINKILSEGSNKQAIGLANAQFWVESTQFQKEFLADLPAADAAECKQEMDTIARNLKGKGKFGVPYPSIPMNLRMGYEEMLGWTPWHKAAAVGDAGTLLLLMEKTQGRIFSLVDLNGNDALKLLSLRKKIIALTLLMKGVERYFPKSTHNLTNFERMSHLTLAQFRSEMIRQKINPNYQVVEEPVINSLSRVVTMDPKKINCLIREFGADVNQINITDPHKNTLLKSLMVNEKHKDANLVFASIEDQLTRLAYRADYYNPQLPDVNGRTDLMHAIIFGFREIFEKLLKLKERKQLNLDLDFKDKEGRTALHIACLVRDVHAIRLLRLHGAKTDIKDKHERIALDYLNVKDVKLASESIKLLQGVSINPQRDKLAKLNSVSVIDESELDMNVYKKDKLDLALDSLGAKADKMSTLTAFADLCDDEKRHSECFVLNTQDAMKLPAEALCVFLHGKDKSFKPTVLSSGAGKEFYRQVQEQASKLKGQTWEQYLNSNEDLSICREMMTMPLEKLKSVAVAVPVPVNGAMDRKAEAEAEGVVVSAEALMGALSAVGLGIPAASQPILNYYSRNPGVAAAPVVTPVAAVNAAPAAADAVVVKKKKKKKGKK